MVEERQLSVFCCLRVLLSSVSTTMLFCSLSSPAPSSFLWLYLLLLLLHLPPSWACHISSLTECQQAQFVPGHNLAGEGYNVVTMKPSGASVVDVKTYMVGGQQGNCTVCLNRLLNKVPAQQARLNRIFCPEGGTNILSFNRPKSCRCQSSTGV